MSDPTTDQRAIDLLSADPDTIDTVQRQYDTAAGNAQWCARGLRAAGRDPQWQGAAADEFRTSIGHFPHELDTICNSYWEVAQVLQTFSTQLAQLQSEYKAALGPDYALHAGQLRTARAAEQRDGALLARLTRTGSGATQRQIDRAAAAVRGDVGTITALEHEVGGHTHRALQVLDDFDTLRNKANAQIIAASKLATRMPAGPVYQPLTGTAMPGAVTGSPLTATASARVSAMTTYANQVMGTPYVSGGGHGGFTANGGLDCSGFVSGTLHSAGYLNAPQTTETLPGQAGIAPGPGRYVTIYDRTDCGGNEHVIIDINGQFYEEGGGTADGGAGNVHAFTPSAAYLQSFNRILHPAGL